MANKNNAVSARAFRNEKARRANAKDKKKEKDTSAAGVSKAISGAASTVKKSVVDKPDMYVNNPKPKQKQSAVQKRAGISDQDYNRMKTNTQRFKNLTKNNLLQIVASHAKTLSAIGPEDREAYETPAKGKYATIVSKPSYDNKKALSDWASKQIDKSAKEIEKQKKGMGKAGKFAADVYGAGLGLATDALAGPFAVGSMFSRSFGSAYDSAEKEGASKGQAMLYGATVGGVEAATEKLFAVAKPLKKIYGKGAADDLTERVLNKMVGKHSGTGKGDLLYHGGKTFAAALTEGLEEMIAEGLEPTIANQIYADALGKHKETGPGQVLYAGAVGGALGGILGGGGQVVEYSQGSQVRDVFGEEGIADMLKKAVESDDAADAVSATAMKAMFDNGDGIVAGQANQLKQAVDAQNVRDTERLQLASDSAVKIMRDNKYIDIVQKIDENGTLELSEHTRIAYEDTKDRAVQEFENNTELQLPEQTVDQITSAIASIKTGAVMDIDAVNMFTLNNPEARAVYETVTGETLPKTNAETRDYLYLKIAENRVSSAEAETNYFVDRLRGVLEQDIATTYDAKGQEAFSDVIAHINPANAGQVQASIVTFEDYYEAGRRGESLEFMNSLDNPVYNALPAEVRKAAYEAGSMDQNASVASAKGVALQLGQKAELNRSQTKSGGQRGKVISKLSKENRSRFTAQQQIMYRKLAQVFNINIEITDDPNMNGFYDNGTITLSVNADRDLAYVFAHEITHHMELYAPEEYLRFKDLVRSSWDYDGLNGAIDAKIRHYADNGVKLSREGALDEILADSTYEMIQDENFVEELCREDRSMAQAILDAMKALIKKLRAVLVDGDKFTPVQNAGLLSQLDILKDAEKLWVDGLMKAAENSDAVGVVESDAITYDSLVSKADMNIAKVTTDVDDLIGLSRKDIVNKARNTLAKKVAPDEKGRLNVFNKDTGNNIVIGKPGINHGLDRNYEYTAIVAMHLDEYLQNAIKINDLIADNSRDFDSDILLGYGVNNKGEKIPAYFVVAHLTTGTDELISFESLYSIRAKKIVEDSAQSSRGVQSSTSTTISIADLLEIVNEMYSDILPASVAAHFGNERRKSKLGDSVRFSIKGENANLSEEEKNNLQTAKEMQKEGKSDEEIYSATGWYTQSDGKWRTEMLDEIAIPENFSRTGLQSAKDAQADRYKAMADENLKNGIPVEAYNELIALAEGFRDKDLDSGFLPKFLDAPKLYEAYPRLEETYLVFSKIPDAGGYTDLGNNTIVLDPENLREAGMTVREGLAHEIQHIIQGVEGFAKGSNPRAAGSFNAYYNTGGEIEARDVEERLKWTPEERRNFMPTKFSLKDSTGRELSQQQAEFFKDSKVRDDKGNLKTMYHGSLESFEAFDKKKAKSSGYYGRGFYFTDSESHAGQYGNLYEVYLDIRNPIQEDMYNITREQFTNFVEAVAADEDYGIDNYGYDATVDSVVESVYGKDDFAMLMDINASCIGDMVAAVKLFNEVNGTDYDGIFASTETVAFYPEQVKDVNNANPTSDPRMKFSLKESVEDTRDLIAVHNIASSELLKTLALGGFPMPSIAVVKDTQSHEKYGDVSVLFGKETIDPKASKANKVYGGDAWTPVFPSIDYKVNRDASEEIEKHVESIIGRELMRLMRTPLDYDNMSDALNRWSGNISDAYGNSDGLRYAFLKEKGIEIDVPTKESRLGRRDNDFYISLAEKLGEEKIQKIHKDCSGEYRNKDNVSLVVDVFNEYVAEKYKSNPKLIAALSIEDGNIGFADFDEMTRGAYKYLNGGVKTEPDVYVLSKNVDEYFEENNVEAEYESWLGNLFSDIIESEGIRNDKDIFTPSGNRRSWDSLHMAVTLENVVKAMKKQAEKGAGIAGFGSPFGAAQRNFKSIEDIRANKDRLQRYNEEGYDEIHSEYADRFTEIAGRFAKKDQFGSTIDAGGALIESVAKSNSKAQLDKYLKADSQWFNYSEDITKDLWELVKDIQSMPTEYFEAKPQRAVGFNEIVSVIVPDNVGDEMLSALEENGIEYVMYEAGNEQDRTDKVNAQAVQNDVKFSLKDDNNVSEDDVNEYINSHPEDFPDSIPYWEYERDAERVKDQTIGELKNQVARMKLDKLLTQGRVLDTSSVKEEVNSLVRMLMTSAEGTTAKTNLKLVDQITENVQGIYRTLKAGNEEDAIINAYNLAEDIVENLQLVNDEMFHTYKDLRDYLRTTKVYISEEDKSNIPDFKDFRRRNMGRLLIVNEGNGGTSIDNMYMELCQMYPGMFDEELTHPADQLQEIAAVRESLEPYDIALNDEETIQLIKETAHDLIEIAANGKPWVSWADRQREAYEGKVEALKQKHKEAIRDIKRKEKDRYETKLAAQKAKADERVQKVKEKGEEKLQAEKDKNKQQRQDQREARQKKELIRKMEKNIQWLSDRLLKPTDDKHLPHGYDKAIAELLCVLDTQTERSKKLEEKYGISKKRFRFLELKKQYEAVAKSEDQGIVFNEDLADMMSKLSDVLEDVTIAEATVNDTEQIYKLLKGITHGLRKQNEFFNDKIKSTRTEAGESIIDNFKNRVDQKGIFEEKKKLAGYLEDLIAADCVSPTEFFDVLGNDKLTELFAEVRKGQDVHIRHTDEARKYFQEHFPQWFNVKRPGSKIEKWGNGKIILEVKLDSGRTIKLTPTQAMTIYAHSFRTQSMAHMTQSGIQLTPIEKVGLFKQMLGRKFTQEKVRLTYGDIEKIKSKLTTEQKKTADAMINFIQTECTAWGNETSMKLHGYEKFKEENYFPIKTSSDYRMTDLNNNEKDVVKSIRNLGMTKAVVPNANNVMVIDDFFDVVTSHINEMSLYHALAVPMADLELTYNYISRNEDGIQEMSVKGAMASAWGRKANNYLETFIRDVNSEANIYGDALTGLLDHLLAAYKKATIGFNARVAVQQPTAIVRAMGIINPKYFVNANTINPKAILSKNIQEMQEHCPIALWKAWGRSQTDVSQGMKETIMNRDWTIVDVFTMRGYGYLDNITWGLIWQAVKKEVKANNPEVKVGSDEFWELCNERASYVFDRTMVVDSVFHRTQVMRKKDPLHKTLTSFMAEPLKTLNQVRTQIIVGARRISDGDKGGAVQIAKALGVYVSQAIAVSAAAGIIDMLRGKDLDDDDEGEGWLEQFINNFITNINPFNMIPLVGDISDITKGYGTSFMPLEGIEAVWDSIEGWIKYHNGNSDTTVGELMKDTSSALGMITGLPIKNLLRELETWMPVFGLEVFAATAEEEPKEPKKGLLDRAFDGMGIKDGSNIDKTLNFFGLNRTDAEQAAYERERTVKALNKQTKNMSDKERADHVWGEVMSGYTKDLETGNIQAVIERRKILEAAGGDVDKFDKNVLGETKTAFKKTIGDPDKAEAAAVLRDYLKTEHGYTDAKISNEILTKTDTAKEFQLALCTNDQATAISALYDLVEAGLTYEDYCALYLGRASAIQGNDYSTGEFNAPVTGTVTSTFGYRDAPTAGASTYHQGIDIAAPEGTVVGAADGGKVSSVGYSKTKGNYVTIYHGNGRYTEYLHLWGYNVQKGDAVLPGQEIGKVGSTGVSTGPHLHFAVKESGTYVDPAGYIGL